MPNKLKHIPRFAPQLKAQCLELYLTRTKNAGMLASLTGLNKRTIQYWISNERWKDMYEKFADECMAAVHARCRQHIERDVPTGIIRHLANSELIDDLVAQKLKEKPVKDHSLKDLKTAADAIKSSAHVIAPILHPREGKSKSEADPSRMVFKGPVQINLQPVPIARPGRPKAIDITPADDFPDAEA